MLRRVEPLYVLVFVAGGLTVVHQLADLGAHPGMLIGAFGIASATLWVALSPIPRLRRAPTA